jgi:hypothetical protein
VPVTVKRCRRAGDQRPGVDVPDTDGLVLDGRRLWAVQSFRNQISRWRLSGDLSSGTLDGVITDPLFRCRSRRSSSATGSPW